MVVFPLILVLHHLCHHTFARAFVLQELRPVYQSMCKIRAPAEVVWGIRLGFGTGEEGMSSDAQGHRIGIALNAGERIVVWEGRSGRVEESLGPSE